MNGSAVDVKQTDEGIAVTIGKDETQPTGAIVVLELDGSAEEIVPVDERILTAGVRVSSSSAGENPNENGPEMTVDGNCTTYWTTDAGVTTGWLEYDLGKPCTFSRAILDEGEDGWIRHVQIQAEIDNEWKTVFEYRHGNPELWKNIPMELFCPEFRFDPVTAQFVRVSVMKATKSPVVYEFSLYER